MVQLSESFYLVVMIILLVCVQKVYDALLVQSKLTVSKGKCYKLLAYSFMGMGHKWKNEKEKQEIMFGVLGHD